MPQQQPQSNHNDDEKEDSAHNDGKSGTVRNNFSPSSVGAAASIDGTTSVASSSWAPARTAYSDTAAAATAAAPRSLNSTPNRRRKGGKSVPLSSSSLPAPTPKKSRYQQQRAEHASRNNDNKEKQPSLTERLSHSALSSTLGILRLAGGITLSTTGTILSPSIEMTRSVLLPHIFAGIVDYISQVSPQRLKDWFRIFSASIYHLIAVIVSTEQGSIFRHKVIRVGGDLLDVVSSDTSRQALMDGMACVVKLSEALHTPEVKALLEQLGVLGCRVIDAAAMGKNKKLVHDWYALLWSGVELANDPATTVAMAEVAAYLCHALEMEDAGLHALAREQEELSRKASQKRRERDEYQRATYQDAYLFDDPNATVEEVILSALGVIQKSAEEASKVNNDGGGDALDRNIPGSVVIGSEEDDESDRPSRATTPPPVETTRDSRGGSLRSENEPNDNSAEDEDEGISNQKIDVGYLRYRITERAETTKQRRLSSIHIPANGDSFTKTSTPLASNKRQMSAVTDTEFDEIDDGRKDIEDLSSLVKKGKGYGKRRKGNPLIFEDDGDANSDGSNVEISMEDLQNEPTPDKGIPKVSHDNLPLEGESAVAHFYRVLDNVMLQTRTDTLGSVLKKSGSAVANDWNATTDAELGADELKKRLQSFRKQKVINNSKVSEGRSGVNPKIAELMQENNILVCTSVLILMSLAAIILGFACYGMYMFVVPPSPHAIRFDPTASPAGGSEFHLPLVLHEDTKQHRKSGSHKNEYVIRVIREVVHVDSNGETLWVEPPRTTSEEL